MWPRLTCSRCGRWLRCPSYVRRSTRRLDIPGGNIAVTSNRVWTSRSGCRSVGITEKPCMSLCTLVLLPVRRAHLSLATQSQACLISRRRGTAEEDSRRLEGQHGGCIQYVSGHHLVEQGKNEDQAWRSSVSRVTRERTRSSRQQDNKREERNPSPLYVACNSDC